MRNQSYVTEFILLGFTGGRELKTLLFIIVFFIYTVSLLGNCILIVIIYMDHRLHLPMYFFLLNLSLVETLNISNFAPLMLVQMLSVHSTIPMANCLTQSFFYFYFVQIVFALMPIMSYDRYVAICNPLRYTTIMNDTLCIRLVIGCWLGSLLVVLLPIVLIARLPYCGPNVVNHFLCDSLALMNLACTITIFLKQTIAIASVIMLLGSLGMTIVSYIFIIYSILNISTTHQRQKAFSTCSSHLTMVTIIYGSAIFVQVSPALNASIEVYKTVFMFGSLMSPLLNPFIYSFRNENVKEAFKELLHRKICAFGFK